MDKAKADLEASKGAKAVAESDLATTLKSLKACNPDRLCYKSLRA